MSVRIQRQHVKVEVLCRTSAHKATVLWHSCFCGVAQSLRVPVQIMDVLVTGLQPTLHSMVYKIEKKKILRLCEKYCTKIMEKGRSFCLVSTTVRGCQRCCVFYFTSFPAFLFFYHGSLYVRVSWVSYEISHNSYICLFDW